MKQTVIIGGGMIEDDFALRFLKEHSYEYVIAADRGLLFLQRHGIVPTHIVGDFDSADAGILEEYRGMPEVTIRRFQPEKDWTDTEIAAELAVELGSDRIDILGATGGRIDHMMGNIQLLALILKRGAEGRLIDSKNCVYMKNRNFTVRRDEQWGKYLSLFAYGGDVTGLTLRGTRYLLDDFILGTVGTRGVSNEIAEEVASIAFTGGTLLVMETRD